MLPRSAEIPYNSQEVPTSFYTPPRVKKSSQRYASPTWKKSMRLYATPPSSQWIIKVKINGNIENAILTTQKCRSVSFSECPVEAYEEDTSFVVQQVRACNARHVLSCNFVQDAHWSASRIRTSRAIKCSVCINTDNHISSLISNGKH
jgi:hypothetical protein